MKRLALTLALGMAAFSAFAQAPFTIVRPADGARVRELVRLLIPKNSVPAGGYIGIFIGGKFVEAIDAGPDRLDKTKKFYEYDLDTKAKGIPDGKLTMEAVLYVDYQDRPRIVDRTSVEVTVANTADAKIPAKGLLLRYKWTPGMETVYDCTFREITDISDAKKNEMGGKPIEQANTLAKFRILYACDNAYGDGSGLVRMQPLPNKGSDSVFVPTSRVPAGERIYADQMTPVYMRLTSTGLAWWGSMPFALPIEGTTGDPPHIDFFALDPLPTLPYNPVKIGGTAWSSRFQDGALPEPQDLLTAHNFVQRSPARGEFKGVEWEMGHPCAKIINSLEVGVKGSEGKKLEKAGREFTGNKAGEVETIWFALDKRQIIKIVRTLSFDQQVAVQNNGFGGGGGNAPPRPGSGPRPSAAGAGGAGAENLAPPMGEYQGGKPMGLGAPGGRGGMGRPGPNSGGSGAPASAMFVRITLEETYILEQ